VKAVEWFLRIGLAGFFVWSGVVKLMDLSGFTEAVGNYQLHWEVTSKGEGRNFFEAPMDAYIAYSLPWFEILAGVALLTRFGKLAGVVVIVVMLISFNWALGDAWGRGLEINCGCFGKSDNPTNYGLKIFVNDGLIVAAVLIAIWPWLSRKILRPG